MEILDKFFDSLSSIVWGPPMLILLVGTGVWLTITLKGLQFSMLPYALKQAFSPHSKHEASADYQGDVSHFGALMTALSATIGTGNIAGVATAVVMGGPGAVFWMWVTAIFGMATKYGEGVLAVKYRTTNERGEMSGGPMYYIENGLGKKWKWMAIAFAGFGTLASFGIGSSVQSNSVAQSIKSSFALDTWITGLVLTIFTGIVVLGGIKSIAKVTSIIVPFMAIFYVLGGLTIIFLHLDLVGKAFNEIISAAFGAQALFGGAVGVAIRYGVARGVFSNEAGMGSAPIAAAAAKTDHPVRQALVSMTGTFLDTIVVCSITGLVLVMGMISTGDMLRDADGQIITGAALTTTTFNHMLPGPGGWIVTIGLIFFAYSTILGWCYYGEKCTAYIFGDKFVPVYRIIYVITVMLGTVVSLDLVWKAADVFNGLMAIPNLVALLLLWKVVVSETSEFKRLQNEGKLYR